MKTPFLGAAYVARSVNAADNRMVNLFPEVIPEGGKERGWLQRTPGLRRVRSIGTGPIRGLWSFGAYAYAVSGDSLYRIPTTGAATLLGTVSGSGPVSMADNGVQLFIATNPDGFIYNSQTQVFEQITDPDFPGALIVGYLDGYFVFIEPQSQRVWVTSLFDGTSVDPLDFASAEGAPDNLVSMIVDHREVWLFGTESTEVWVNSGGADFPLERVNGAFNEVGCAAPYSVAKADNSVFWLGADDRGQGMVYRANGYTAARVSTHAVEWQVQSYGDISDAVGFTYQQDGHAFYVLTFPAAGKTWAYDAAANAWHERAGFFNGQFVRHRAACQTSFNNEVWVGDYEDGRVYALDLDVYEDDDRPQKWLRSWRALPTGGNNLRRTAHHELQLDCESGVGLTGIDTTVVLVDIELLTEDGQDLLTEDAGANAAFATFSSMPDYTPGTVQINCASDNNVVVAVTFSGQIVASRSLDGSTWSAWAPVDAAIPTATCNAVSYFNDQFALAQYVSPNARLYTSVDGAAWTARAVYAAAAAVSDFAYGAGVWVMVRGNQNYEYSADNLATAAAQTFPSGIAPNRVCFTGTHFVATDGTGRAAYSTTGLSGSWTLGAYATGSPSTDWIGAASASGVTIIRRNGTTSGAYSTDNGATWTLSTMPIQNAVQRMTYASNGFVMADSSGAAYSEDGVSWSAIAPPVNATFQGISAFQNTAVSTAGSVADGVWASLSLAAPVGGLTAVIASDGSRLMIRSGTSPARIFYSLDQGLTWTETTTNLGNGNGQLYYGNGVWILPQGQNSILAMRSSDGGVTFVSLNLPSGSNVLFGAFGNGAHVLIGDGPRIERSVNDGTTWTSHSTITGRVTTDFIFAGDRFVRVASSAHASWSTDGITWTEVSVQTGAKRIAYGNGVIVGCIQSATTSYVYSLDNGQTWTSANMPSSQTWTDVAFGGDRFMMIAGGTGNTIAYYSFDGINWTATTTAIVRANSRIAYASPYFVSLHGNLGLDGQRWISYWPQNYAAQWDLGAPLALLLDQKQAQGVVPKVMLRWSDDGGHTWSNEHWRELGRAGEYGTRVKWRRLGMTQKLRDRVYEVSSTDPVKIALMGAELNLSGTNGG
jgi:hypothetical protein